MGISATLQFGIVSMVLLFSARSSLQGQVCVVQNGQLSSVMPQYNPSTGDTVGLPSIEANAQGATWYINNEPITFNGSRYLKYGLPRVLQVGDVNAVGSYEGVSVFAEPSATAPMEVVYIPVGSRCEFQPYQVERRSVHYRDGGEELPELMPWPPPRPTDRVNITRLVVQPSPPRTLGDVADRLENAFLKAGYGSLDYYAVPQGFAVVASFEQIDANANPVPPPNRFTEDVAPPSLHSISDIVSALFTAHRGYYRLIIVVVSSRAFNSSQNHLSPTQANRWRNAGLNVLPLRVARLPFDGHSVTALVYEFTKANDDQPVVFQQNGRFVASEHLRRAGIWQHLEARR